MYQMHIGLCETISEGSISWFGEFAHFVDVLAGDAQPMLTGQDGLEVLGIVAGAYIAAAENRIVTPPWPKGPDIVSRPWLDR